MEECMCTLKSNRRSQNMFRGRFNAEQPDLRLETQSNTLGRRAYSTSTYNNGSNGCEHQWRGQHVSARGGRGRGGPRHPPGLKGKEIGLWYAKRGRQTKKQEIQQLVTVDDSNKRKLENLLSCLSTDGNPDMSLDEKPNLSVVKTGPASFPNNEQTSPINTFKMENKPHFKEENVKKKTKTGFQIFSLIKDETFDRQMLLSAQNKKSPKYFEMQEYRRQLPAYKKMNDVLCIIKYNQVVVIVGETGCGKTTQVPQYILDSYIQSGNASTCHVICTQPRRISAISVAERVADERDEVCGSDTVGYHIRLENKIPPERGSIIYCTTGMVLQYLNQDPDLLKASHLIIDEVHERDLHTDFLMTILKDVLARRPELKLILMSATLNAEKFSKYFGNCSMLEIPGFTHPVKEYFLEDVLQMTNYVVHLNNVPKWKTMTSKRKNIKEFAAAKEYELIREPFLRSLIGSGYSSQTITSLRNINEDDIDHNLTKQLIKYICISKPEGAILVFLTGWAEIGKLNSLLTQDPFYSRRKHLIIPLHSMMPTINQREVFERPPNGVRKIILATNIAETSITINDVVYVIDCGKIKITNFNVAENIATLQPQWVSLANARQRRGRAGRVRPGICFHLYSKVRENILDAYQLPEIQRTRLETLCLNIKLLKLGKIQPFLNKTMDPPETNAVYLAIQMLQKLNALDSEENLTPLGYHLAKLPLDPQTGKMILFGAIFRCLDPILTVAASLDFKDAFVSPLGLEKQVDQRKKELAQGHNSDHIMLINAYQGWEAAKLGRNDYEYCRKNFLSKNTLLMLEKMRRQLAEHLFDAKLIDSANPKSKEANWNCDNIRLIQAVVCAGLYPNVAKITINEHAKDNYRKRPPAIKTREDGRVAFHLKSVNSTQTDFESAWLVYHLKLKSTKIFIHDATVVRPLPLIFFGSNLTFLREGASGLIKVDDYITFHCPEATARLILKLRAELDSILDYKISHPGCTEWDSGTREGGIMRAIVDLITKEKDLTKTSEEVNEKVDVDDDDDNDNDL